MWSKNIAVYNKKGGIGKTSITVNLAIYLASRGYSVLVCDFNSQGDSSKWLLCGDEDFANRMRLDSFFRALRVPPEERGKDGEDFQYCDNVRDLIRDAKIRTRSLQKGGSTFAMVEEGETVKAYTLNLPNLKVIPAAKKDMFFGTITGEHSSPASRTAAEKELYDCVRKMVEPLREDFDFIFFDMPAELGNWAEAVFTASDYILFPITSAITCLESFPEMQSMIENINTFNAGNVDVLGIIHNAVDDSIGATLKFKLRVGRKSEREFLFDTRLVSSGYFASAYNERIPIMYYAPNSKLGKAYEELTEEFLRKVGEIWD